MSDDQPDMATGGRISPGVVGLISAVGWALALGALTGGLGWLGAMVAILTDLPVALAVFIAAGGWGWLAAHKLFPRRTPAGLVVVTSVVIGLWLLATAMLAVGSAVPGAMSPWLWWPVVAGGAATAAAASRKAINKLRLPGHLGPAGLLWVTVALAGALWVAGATMPPGTVGLVTGDAYDVLSYHLQAPREFHDAGRILFLPHNTYSNYPLGAEMLFLLTACLKGGPQTGIYAAKFTHGLWGVLAVLTIILGLPGARHWRRRTAAILLATTPIVVYLSWLAFVELSELACLAVGVAWLRVWLARPSWRAAVIVGLAVGVACSTKYLSVGLVAGPVLAVMLAVCLRRPARLRQWAAACLACAALMSPWLVRNTANTGNPVFPLATGLLGQGNWSDESATRWEAGHGAPPWAEKARKFTAAMLDKRGPGVWLPALAAGGLVWTIMRRRRGDPLDWICAGLLAVQLAVWALLTHMPSRFLLPAAVPMAILAGGLTARLARPRAGRGYDPAHPAAPWALRLALALVCAAVGWHLLTGWRAYRQEPNACTPTGQPIGLHGMSMDELANLPGNKAILTQLTGSSRLLLVGEARALHFPANTLYATAWEMGPLVRIAHSTRQPERIIRRLQSEFGVTHILVNWSEVRRLRETYGWWGEVDRDLIDSLIAAGAEDLPIAGKPLPEHMLLNGRPILQLLALP